MENSTAPPTLPSLLIDELASYHSLLLEKANDENPEHTNPDTPALMSFNGYYALNTTGAFFAIDTNMVISPSKKPVYHLRLLISLDGITSKSFTFTGTFDGNNLIQNSPEVNIALTLTRTNAVYGTTASLTGTIAMQGKPAVNVNGSTYNNPIPASLFVGDYSYIPKGETEAVKVMSIGADHQLMYDNGTNSGNLVAIPKYAYNLNMYYFSFNQADSTKVKLIMGTAAAQGFACNNMSIDGSTLVSRSLVTLPNAKPLIPEVYDLSGIQLADFSGYYQIPTKEHPLAFISIQAQYATLSELLDWDLNFVMISYSLDGITSTGLMFNPFASMSFDNATNVLTIPGTNTYDAINLKFTREYNSQDGSLVSIKGNIGTLNVQGSTLFNPVPLSAFGGVTMTSPDGKEKLTINNDNSITHTEKDGSPTTINNLIYVPLMYIVAAPATDPTIMLSLGTDGLRGLTCIVINNPSTTANTTAVYAINGPE